MAFREAAQNRFEATYEVKLVAGGNDAKPRAVGNATATNMGKSVKQCRCPAASRR
jgi:hypothetical protein